MSIFKPKGFDTFVSKDTVLVGEAYFNGETVLDGIFRGQKISHADDKKKASLTINGGVTAETISSDSNVVINGTVTVEDITVHGVLAIHKNARVSARRILYKHLVIQPGARLEGQMICLTEDVPVAAVGEPPSKV